MSKSSGEEKKTKEGERIAKTEGVEQKDATSQKSGVTTASKQKPPPTDDAAKIVDPIDKNAVFLVRGAVIGLGVAGLAVMARSMRLFTKFGHVREIPSEFIRKEMRLRGKLKAVQLDGTLRIEHEPIFRLPRLWPAKSLTPTQHDGYLTVRLAGMEISEPGVCYLREDFSLLDRPVILSLVHRPLTQDPNIVECEVSVRKNMFTTRSINQELIRRGLARVPGVEDESHLATLKSVPAYSRLVNQLLLSEKVADRRGVGMWERDTWVESLRALPYQLGEMVRTSPATRFTLLILATTKNALLTTGRVLRFSYSWASWLGGWLYSQSQKTKALVSNIKGTSTTTTATKRP